MRVIHVAPTPFGETGLFGGGERYPLELARALASLVDCELVTFGPRPGTERGADGLRVTTLRPFMRLRGHPVHPLALGLPGALRGADLLHAHHMRSAPARFSALIAAARGVPAAVTDHGLGGGGWGGALPRLFDRFLTVSRYSAAVLGVPAERTRVLYGGADTARFAPDPAAHREGILFLGRLTPHKGIDRLIRALPEGSRLRVAGTAGHDPRRPESGYPELLRRLGRGREVELLGRIDDDDLPRLLRSASVLALPSVEVTCYGKPVAISELLSLTAIEAMASGTPVVASRVGGVPEVVADGETGLLVDPGDVEALRDGLSRLLGDPASAARMGRAGRDLVHERFTWPECARRAAAAYEEMLKMGGATADSLFGMPGSGKTPSNDPPSVPEA